MAHRSSRSETAAVDGDDRYEQEACRHQHDQCERQSEESARSNSASETWLCRSTVGQDLSDMSDGDDDALDGAYDSGAEQGEDDAEAWSATEGNAPARGGVKKELFGDEQLEDKRLPTPFEPKQRKRSVFEGGRWPAQDGAGGLSLGWKQQPAIGRTRGAMDSGSAGAGSAAGAGDDSAESDAFAAECKPAAPPTPPSKIAPPPKLPRIMGWSNIDALRGKLPHAKRRSAPGAATGTVSVGREQLGTRTKSGAMRPVAASSRMKKQWQLDEEDGHCKNDDAERKRSKYISRRAASPGHRKRYNDHIGNHFDDSGALADRIQRKIDSAEWNRRRDEEMGHHTARYFDEPDILTDRIQQKMDSAGWDRPRSAAAHNQADGYFDEVDTLADRVQQKIDRAGWNQQRREETDRRNGDYFGESDNLADGIQQKIDRAGWNRPREEATQGRIARYVGRLDTLAGKLQHKIGRAAWTRRRTDAVSGGVNGRLNGSEVLADKIQQKIDREGWGQTRDGAARVQVDSQFDDADALADKIQQKIDREGWDRQGDDALDKRPFDISADADMIQLKPTRQHPSLERKLRALAPLAPAVTVGKHAGLPLFAEKTGDDQLQQKLGKKLRRMDDLSSPSELKIVVDNGDAWVAKCSYGDNEDNSDDGRSKPENPSPRGASPLPSEFRVSETLTHLIVFASTATLHCVVFTFSTPLRRALSLESYPFGIVLLVCWAIEGLARCIGGVLGDLVADRVALLRRAVLLWALAVVLFLTDAAAVAMAATSTMSSLSTTLASAILGAAFLFGGGAHGTIVPNMVALGAQAALYSHRTQSHSLFSVSTPKTPSPRESMSMTRIYSEDSEEEEAGVEGTRSSLVQAGTPDLQEVAEERDDRSTVKAERARFCVNRYYSASFAATTAGSSIAQVFFFVFTEELSATPAPSSSSSSSSFSVSSSLSSLSTSSSLRGIIFLGVTGAVLLGALGTFMYQSRAYSPRSSVGRPQSLCQRLRRAKAARAADEKSDEPLSSPSVTRWLLGTHGTPIVVVGYALIACTALLFAGAISAVVILAVFPQSALAVRLSPFLAVMATWLAGMAVASRMLKAVTTRRRSSEETNEEDVKVDEDDELPEADEHQRDVRVQFALALLALGGALACAAFVRGQLYSTVATQLCQTNVELPSALVGSARVSLRPEVAGGAVGLCSVLLLVVLMQLDYIRQACVPRSKSRPSRSRWSWLQLASTAPATRMAVAAALSLIGLFLASVVELYRRHAPLLPVDSSRVPTRQCIKPAVDLNLLWSTPALVVLGVADALFRVSLHEQVHVALLQCHDAGLCNRWAGRVLGALALAESLGNAAALALVAALASWLLGPTSSDLTLVFLLLTTALALTFVMLKSVGKRVARVAVAALKRATSARAASREARVITVVTPPPPPMSSSFEFTDEAIKKLMTAAGG